MKRSGIKLDLNGENVGTISGAISSRWGRVLELVEEQRWKEADKLVDELIKGISQKTPMTIQDHNSFIKYTRARERYF